MSDWSPGAMDLPEENTMVLNMMGEFNSLLSSKFETSRQEQLERQRLGERLTDKSRITRLEGEIEVLKHSHKRARVEAEKDYGRESRQKKGLESKVEDLQNKLTFLVNRDDKRSQELMELKSSKDALRNNYEEQIRELKQKKLKLETMLQESQMSSRSHISKLKNEVAKRDPEMKMLKVTIEETKERLQQERRKAATAGSQRRILEEYKAELYQVKQSNKELLQQLEQREDDVSLARAVGNDVRRLPQLEEENRKLVKENEYLSATNENNHLLKEKAVGLEAKLARTEKRLTEMAQLQVENEELQEKNARLEAMNSQTERAAGNSEELMKKIKGLEEHVQEQTEIIQMYKDQQNMKGGYDSMKTKVVSLSMNPAAELKQRREEEQEKLEGEVGLLRERVRILEEMGNEANTQEIKVQLEKRNSKEVDELKKELKGSQLRAQRLKEVFRRKIQEFREACYRLTGYLINSPSDNEYNLISMYAEESSDKLLFRSTPEGDMQLLENEFSASLPDLIDAYLKEQDSIPAFLSSLTLDLFSRQTTMIQGESLI